MGADIAAIDPIPRALQLAARTRRPHYVLRGEILEARPAFGPFMIAWPSGDVEAIGVGRKKQRQRRNSGMEDDPGDEGETLEEDVHEEDVTAEEDPVAADGQVTAGGQRLLDLDDERAG